MRTWIVIADVASARVLESNKRLGDWTLVRELSHPESRAHAAQLVSDKPGRVRQITTGARVAMEAPTPLKRKEAEKFARQLAAALEDATNQGAFDRLILVECDQELQISRALKRDNGDRSEVLARLERQMPVEEKRKFADYVIDTSGSKEETLSRVREVYDSLRRISQ